MPRPIQRSVIPSGVRPTIYGQFIAGELAKDPDLAGARRLQSGALHNPSKTVARAILAFEKGKTGEISADRAVVRQLGLPADEATRSKVAEAMEAAQRHFSQPTPGTPARHPKTTVAARQPSTRQVDGQLKDRPQTPAPQPGLVKPAEPAPAPKKPAAPAAPTPRPTTLARVKADTPFILKTPPASRPPPSNTLNEARQLSKRAELTARRGQFKRWKTLFEEQSKTPGQKLAQLNLRDHESFIPQFVRLFTEGFERNNVAVDPAEIDWSFRDWIQHPAEDSGSNATAAGGLTLERAMARAAGLGEANPKVRRALEYGVAAFARGCARMSARITEELGD